MKIQKKILASLLAVSMIGTALAGCSSSSKESKDETSSGASSTESAESTKPVNIEFWTISLQPTFTEFFNGLIKTYQEENKNVTVKWVDLPYDSIQQKLITAVAGGTAPDVVNLNTQLALTLAGKDALVDLNAEATDEQKGIYIESLYNSAKIDHSVYAFPWYASPSVMLYNKDLFTKAGITETPKTYEDAFTLAKTMKDATGAYLFNPNELMNIMYLDSLSILSDDKKTANFNNADTLDLLNNYKTYTKAGTVPNSDWGKWEVELKLFETGKLAIINSSGSSISRIKDEAPDVYANLAIAEPMVGKSGVSLDPIMNLVIPKAGKNQTQAIDFASYITNDANQLAFCKQVAIFPSTKVASEDSYFTADETTLEGQARSICAKTLKTSADVSLGVENQSEVMKQVNKMYEATIMGDTDAQKAINDAETAVNQLLATNK